MIAVKSVKTQEGFKLVETLASQIWYQHYPDIIGLEQVEYMLAKFNSAKAIEEQVRLGAQFYCLIYNETPVGYMAIKPEDNFLFLSKLYVAETSRGKGVGRVALNFIDEEAKKQQLLGIRLKVNKYNTASIAVYEKLDFKNVKASVTDIGNGFVMDDFEMEKLF
ncbi:GNAT family N-acetyltransferase [Algibacter lectus]|uniref:GCN5-related N-acetyltransferase n=1 Tax=Algibacter lectus TaxID=221126 RepID=A0A090WWM7_9FLAO|nr:GNAT family N-acetyltransferase [Algibacter lectus]GAL63834.1 GCN5-related N-acetyltransferase [Algibacter lectus]GAL81495.1 GCN5-related N-acetyltransferase [Algibacter lectus]